jgi:hypothetical protein
MHVHPTSINISERHTHLDRSPHVSAPLLTRHCWPCTRADEHAKINATGPHVHVVGARARTIITTLDRRPVITPASLYYSQAGPAGQAARGRAHGGRRQGQGQRKLRAAEASRAAFGAGRRPGGCSLAIAKAGAVLALHSATGGGARRPAIHACMDAVHRLHLMDRPPSVAAGVKS